LHQFSETLKSETWSADRVSIVLESGGKEWIMSRSGIQVLVVEDDELEREALADLLTSTDRFVVTASNGLEALVKLKADPGIRLIILDMAMPVMDGWRFLAEKMKDPFLAPIKVIVLSAYEFPAPRLFSSLIEAFLKKPVALKDLILFIDRICTADPSRDGLVQH
jgi:CheY-like chemotaxis protein